MNIPTGFGVDWSGREPSAFRKGYHYGKATLV